MGEFEYDGELEPVPMTPEEREKFLSETWPGALESGQFEQGKGRLVDADAGFTDDRELANMNDTGMTFREIAGYLRENWRSLRAARG